MPTSSKPSLGRKVSAVYQERREAARSHRALNATWRLIVLVFGLSLLGLGIFFILFPGPGWATILLALIVLGSEFNWANRLLHPVRKFTSALALRLMSDEYKQRRMHILIGSTFAFVVLLYAYWDEWGLTLDGVRSIGSYLLGF